MSNSVDPDETAHYEPSHLDLSCLQKPIIIAFRSERVKRYVYQFVTCLCAKDVTSNSIRQDVYHNLNWV